tara:strand:- start:351 stop:524 length:174 start_codon:yes stop_codon:yes gene_type:complete
MQCPGNAVMGIQYDNWKDCVQDGYKFASRHLEKLDKTLVNKQKISVKFECKQVGSPT